MKQALKIAAEAKAKGELPFSCVIVRDGQVVATGASAEKADGDVTSHAELQAVHQACRKLGAQLTDCVLYATGEPCNMCASSIFQAEISRVVIAAARADLPNVFRQRKIGIKDLAADSSYQPTLEFGLFKDEAMALFADIKRH